MGKALIKNIGSSIKSQTKNYFSSQAERFKNWAKNLTFKKVLLGILDFYNPLNFIRFLKKEFKQNKLIFTCLLALSVFFIAPIAFADFDLSIFDVSGIIDVMLDTGSLTKVASTPYNTCSVYSRALYTYSMDIYDNLVPFGIALTTGYWMISFGENSLGREQSIETISMQFIRLAIMVGVVTKGKTILSYVTTFSNTLIDFVKGYLGSTTINFSMESTLGIDTFFAPISHLFDYLLPLLVLWLGSLVAYVVIYLVCLGRIIRIHILLAFAPFGCADLNGGWHSAGATYFKNYFAYCLQGAMITAATGLGAVMLGKVLSPGAGVWGLSGLTAATAIPIQGVINVIIILAVLATICGILTKTEQFAKLLAGTH